MNPSVSPPRRLLVIACIISFFCFFGSYMRIPIVPLLATSLGANPLQVGIISGAFMLMAGTFSIPAGIISDRLGRRRTLLMGLFILASSSLLLYWTNSLLQMAFIYLLFGVGLSAFSPSLMAYVADVTPPEVLGKAYGWYTMALYGGMTIGPAAGGFLGSSEGLRSVFPVAGGLIFALFFVTLFFLPSQSTSRSNDRKSPAIIVSLKILIENRQLIACLVATIGSCVGYGMFITFMPLFMHSQGMSTVQVGFVFTAQALANALSRIPSGLMCDKVPDRSLLVSGGLLFFAVAIASFGLCHSILSLVAIAAVLGISMGVAYTVICALIVDAVPREMRGLAVGCYNTCIYSGMLLGSVAMGAVIRGEGFRIAFFVNGTACSLVLILFRWMYPRQPSRSLPQPQSP